MKTFEEKGEGEERKKDKEDYSVDEAVVETFTCKRLFMTPDMLSISS